ncbi:hypothetical protein BCR37DRAFT_143063 [Protomyces lactucae-debilis]|uniref:Uncharacterized protein n=1 Tax=Protomyces lactucae-debilis TaxID=2754530 RepID=A0A1Y2FSX8_PROLT|nr:uncharacterized protein BCR37DRAFT_143063 [Protomyces lactucae-debilis]ORY87078.1 hypothetical protein BCR37DRAFT_143063 [Protomyces lactucae-debilis]
MSSNTVDYKDSRIDPGGDKQYDSSAYGTTTGDLKSDKYDQGVFGAGDDKQEDKKQEQPREKQVEANITTQSTSSGQVAGEGKTHDESKAKQVQGYSATGDMNPEVGA